MATQLKSLEVTIMLGPHSLPLSLCCSNYYVLYTKSQSGKYIYCKSRYVTWNGASLATIRAAERIGRAQSKYKKWGPQYRLCKGFGDIPPDKLTCSECVLGASKVPFHACIQHLRLTVSEKYNIQGPSGLCSSHIRKMRCAFMKFASAT